MDNIFAENCKLIENEYDSKVESRNESDLFDCFSAYDDNRLQNNADDISPISNEASEVTDLIKSTATETIQTLSENIDPETDSTEVDQGKDFVPTIVDIRGACNESIDTTSISCDSKTSKDEDLSKISIINVQGSCEVSKDEISNCIEDSNVVVHTIDDDEEPVTSLPSESELSSTVTIKQEPRDEDDDCMLIDSDEIGTCFTSEIEIKEERPNTENEEQEVYCIESTSQIPSPIPIKKEPNVDNDKEISSKSSNEEVVESSPEKPNSKEKSKTNTKLYSAIGYTCHLCNTTFQEHELLNEHMTLHRNNSLVDKYGKSYGKYKKHVKYICRTCGKRLSTGQSLQQHTMIHNNEKPHVCPICKKDFRHLSNFKMHVQKHKEDEEQRRKEKELRKLLSVAHSNSADRSMARSTDFGRLVGPLFVKETLLQKKPIELTQRTQITPKIEKTPFDLKFSKPRDSVKENLVFYKKISSANSFDERFSRTRKLNEDIGDDVIPLKTFNNVENIVMNATKLIVKVDNLDPNLLKKKIKTPDISIDKSMLENKPPDRKRRILLSPSDKAKKLKLDQIENIIMDVSPEPIDDAQNIDDPLNDDHVDYDDDDDAERVARSSKPETLTDNELFELLNDDKESTLDDLLKKDDKSSHLVSENANTSKSNVIVLKNADKTASNQTENASDTKPDTSFSQFMAEKSKEKVSLNTLNDFKSYTFKDFDEDGELEKSDAYDNAFRNVAIRRLTLIHKKASQNSGKVENKYLLGPLFWRRALHKAQKNQLTKEPELTVNNARNMYRRLNAMKYGKMDTRRTNDPAKLQQRAELKLHFILDRIKLMNDLSSISLAGPLFWKRTLKLAGVHNAKDLRTLLNNDKLNLNDVEFVKSEELPKEKKEVNSEDDVIVIEDEKKKPEPVQPRNVVADFLENLGKSNHQSSLNSDVLDSNDKNKIVDSMLNDEVLNKKPEPCHTSVSHVLKSNADSTKEPESKVVKADSILYDSLTKPRKLLEKKIAPIPASKPVQSSALKNSLNSSAYKTRNDLQNLPIISNQQHKPVEPKSNNSFIDRFKLNVNKVASPIISEIPDSTTLDSGNLILNVDSANFQLIADSKAENGDDTNYVLVSDENGSVQLIKENDLHLVEDEASNTQYVVNMQGDNYGNFDLIGNPGGEQLTYAIQLDGENYTTLQFVQDGIPMESDKDKEVEKAVSLEGTNYVLAEPADLNHIGKELSDFLHIDYGTLGNQG